MKKLIFLFLLFLTLEASAQDSTVVCNIGILNKRTSLGHDLKISFLSKPELIDYFRFSCIFISGACEGLREVMKFYPDNLPHDWNPANTWQNKWKNGDPLQGPAFFQSTGVLIGFTDKYHGAGLLRTVSTTCYTASVVYKFGTGERLKSRTLLVKMGAEVLKSFFFYNTGKTLVMWKFDHRH